LALAADNEIT